MLLKNHQILRISHLYLILIQASTLSIISLYLDKKKVLSPNIFLLLRKHGKKVFETVTTLVNHSDFNHNIVENHFECMTSFNFGLFDFYRKRITPEFLSKVLGNFFAEPNVIFYILYFKQIKVNGKIIN